MPDLTPDDLPRLAAFVARWSGHDLTRRAAALREACLSGDGTWIEPGAGSEWAAHSCHACSLLHLWADGDTPEELARNWFTAARRVLIELRPDDALPVERAA